METRGIYVKNNGFKKEYVTGRKDQWDIDYKIMMKGYEDQGAVLRVSEGEHGFRDNEGVEREGGRADGGIGINLSSLYSYFFSEIPL